MPTTPRSCRCARKTALSFEQRRGPARRCHRLGQKGLHAVRRRAPLEGGRYRVFYLRAHHAYAAEDRRPQPLGTIPTPDGVPANLINKDPIAVRGAKVPLEFVAANGGKLSGTTSQLVKKGGTAAAVTAVPDEALSLRAGRPAPAAATAARRSASRCPRTPMRAASC